MRYCSEPPAVEFPVALALALAAALAATLLAPEAAEAIEETAPD